MKNICYEMCNPCNLDCDYCISSDNKGIENYPYDEIIAFIKKIYPQRVVLSGGEPLIDKDLVPKVKLLRESLPNSFISLSSNGTIDFDFSTLKDYIDCIDISLPTLDKEVYKQMRGKDKVDQVLENINKILSHQFYTRVSCMLTKVNIDTIPELLNYLQNQKIDEVRLGRFFPFRNAAKLNEKYSLTDIELEQFLEKLPLSEYSFKIVRPIKSLSLMENGYLTVNYGGEVFYPTGDGKRILGTVGDINPDSILNASNTQEQIFVGMSTKKPKAKEKVIAKS